ncbi:polysaccharide deacetylase family protein [Bradyrhizobium cajani]|uniref:Chitooligosaccharide deacetylase n=1 Tax=Bradyrhizobium cajani TaxID=1928661 RepID=A0A844TKA9_9BRAD|nr:polysaccharide deacetylase family protein [Bradyrhizobium cajani]MCP3374856.1 polysaccharide deacetylase family protein [Bradyrhizobium cajani]MVT77925.1 polysaccharide deacetylase family protein [Bradyrhizobium cajani]
MRNALGLMLASVVAAVVIAAGGWFYYSARADQGAPKTTAARAADPLPAPAKLAARNDVETTAAIAAKPAAASASASAPAPAMPVQQKQACANPNALGVARVVEIDTTGGPGFGFEHFKQFDFLTDKEVVLTFDDGPWPVNTPAVLKALADECTKGLFFSVGKHATYHPEILRQVLAQGHTVGTHTWSHVNLNSKKMTESQVKDEVEKGFSAVRFALGTNPAPFFRFPQLQHNPAMVSYFGTRNVAMFSTDIDSFDFRKGATPEKIVETVMTRLDKLGKGIILMHDFQKHTGEAMPALLARLKAGGYKIVQMKAKTTFQTLPEYDEALMKDMKVPTASTTTRPISSVVQTVSQ